MSEEAQTYQPKTTTETLPLTASVFLKYEATPATRVQVPATKGTKIGQLVQYALANNVHFVALSDEKDGKVIIQPLNCVMDTRQIADTEITKAGGYEAMMKAWLAYGVSVDDGDSRKTD